MTLCLHSFKVINISFILLITTRTFHFVFALVIISQYTFFPSSPFISQFLFFFFYFRLLVHSSFFPALFAWYFPSLFNLSFTSLIIFSLNVYCKVKTHIWGLDIIDQVIETSVLKNM